MGVDFDIFFLLGVFIGYEGTHPLVCEGLEQNGVWYTAVDDVRAADSGFYSLEGTADFWQHAPAYRAVTNELVDLLSCQAGENLLPAVQQAGNIGQ
jgi:hypothetical protein